MHYRILLVLLFIYCRETLSLAQYLLQTCTLDVILIFQLYQYYVTIAPV